MILLKGKCFDLLGGKSRTMAKSMVVYQSFHCQKAIQSYDSQGIILNNFNVKKINGIKKKRETHQFITCWDDWQLLLSYILKFDFPNKSSLCSKLITDSIIGLRWIMREGDTGRLNWHKLNFLRTHPSAPITFQLKFILLLPKLSLNCAVSVTESGWCLFKAVGGVNAMSIQKWSHGYKSAFSKNWKCGKSHLFSRNYFRIQFARQRMSASPPTPYLWIRLCSFYLFISFFGVGLKSPGRVPAC